MSLGNIHFSQLHVVGETYNQQAHVDALCANCAAVQFSAECTNNGDQSLGNFRVKFILDGHTEHYADIHGLSPGASQWAQWRHNPLPAGDHSIHVMIDPNDRVHESDETDNSYMHPFQVLAAVPECRAVSFEAETVTGHVDFAKHGWKQIDVNFTMKNPIGGPLDGYAGFVKFYGPANEESSPSGQSTTNEHGLLRCADVWLKPTGSLYLTAVPVVGGRYEGGPTLEGNGRYTLAANATSIFFDVQQGKEEVIRTATSQQEASENLKLEGKIGVKFEIVELGGGVTHDEGKKETHGQQVQWKVTVGTPALTVTQAQ